jgi:transcriptional regulator of arginine metabolism
MLRGVGIRVTQSTLSRDMRELGLVKVRGTYVAAPVRGPASSEERVRQALRQFVLDTDISGNMLVLKTDPGNGHPLGVAIDAAQWPEVVGTVAGDDTVFVLVRSVRVGKSVLKRIGGYTK